MNILLEKYVRVVEMAVVLLFLCGCRTTTKDHNHLSRIAADIAHKEWLTGNDGQIRLMMADLGKYPAIGFVEQEWKNTIFLTKQWGWTYFMVEFFDIGHILHFKRKKSTIAIRRNNHFCLQSDNQVMDFLNPIPAREKTISEPAIALIAALAFGELRGYSVPDSKHRNPDSHNIHLWDMRVLEQEEGWRVSLPFMTDAFVEEVYHYTFILDKNRFFSILEKQHVSGGGYK
jgi:hypothetical protein